MEQVVNYLESIYNLPHLISYFSFHIVCEKQIKQKFNPSPSSNYLNNIFPLAKGRALNKLLKTKEIKSRNCSSWKLSQKKGKVFSPFPEQRQYELLRFKG